MNNSNTNIATIEQKIKLMEFKQAEHNYLMEQAKMMASASVAIPNHLKGKPADCLAIILKSIRWNMDAYEVAQGTSIVNGAMTFNAQLINAVISSSTAISGRFHYEYSGDWHKISGRVQMTRSKNGHMMPSKGWSDSDELGLLCRVGAVLSGEKEITWGEYVPLSSITTRNSPLWVTAPKQQIGYLAMKYWARFYTPDVTMGVYDKESLEQPIERKEREINPTDNLNSIFADKTDQNEPVMDVEPEFEQVTADEQKEPSVDSNAPTHFEVVRNYINDIVDQDTFQVASDAFNQSARDGTLTPDELNELHALMSEKCG